MTNMYGTVDEFKKFIGKPTDSIDPPNATIADGLYIARGMIDEVIGTDDAFVDVSTGNLSKNVEMACYMTVADWLNIRLGIDEARKNQNFGAMTSLMTILSSYTISGIARSLILRAYGNVRDSEVLASSEESYCRV